MKKLVKKTNTCNKVAGASVSLYSFKTVKLTVLMRFFGWNLDFLGFSASFLCAVHCLALPIVLAFGMFGGSAWLENEAIEMTLIMCSVLLASYSLGKSYLTKHRQIRPLLWLIPGFAFLFLAHDLPGNWHHYLMALGGFTLAFAHYVNWRLLSNRAPALA